MHPPPTAPSRASALPTRPVLGVQPAMARRVSPTKAAGPAAGAALFEKRSLSTLSGVGMPIYGWSVPLDHTFPYVAAAKRWGASALPSCHRYASARSIAVVLMIPASHRVFSLLPSSPLFSLFFLDTNNNNDNNNFFNNNNNNNNNNFFNTVPCRMDRRKPKAGRGPATKSIRKLGMFMRLRKDAQQTRAAGGVPAVEVSHPAPLAQEHGVPLGGLGGGTIGRGWRGDFNRWQLQPGVYSYKAVAADQFVLHVRQDGETVLHVVLHPGRSSSKNLGAWNWGLQGSQAQYRALYPMAWTEYTFAHLGLRLVCQQISPVLPGNYTSSSLPCAVFEWTVENSGVAPLEVTLTFTFQNGTGAPDDKAGGHTNHLFNEQGPDATASGVLLRSVDACASLFGWLTYLSYSSSPGMPGSSPTPWPLQPRRRQPCACPARRASTPAAPALTCGRRWPTARLTRRTTPGPRPLASASRVPWPHRCACGPTARARQPLRSPGTTPRSPSLVYTYTKERGERSK